MSNSLNDIKALSEKYLDVLMEENTKTTATVDVKLDGNKLDVMISNIADAPEVEWGEPINGLTFQVKTGGNNLPYPLFILAGLKATDTPLKMNNIPGMSGKSSQALYMEDMIQNATIGAGDQDTGAAIDRIYITEDKINIVYNTRKTDDLNGKYKKFEVTASMKSVFGRKGESYISDLQSSDVGSMEDQEFMKKFGKGISIKNSEKAKVTIQSR